MVHRPNANLPTANLIAALLGASAVAAPAVAHAEAPVDPAIARIIDEEMNHGEVMTTASALMDRIGPRLTNSENQRKAQGWAIGVLRSYGLTVHEEPFAFGLGWNLDSYGATMTSPRLLPLTVIPVAWSPATKGTISAPVVVAPMTREDNFAQWKGKLAGKIVLVSLPGETSESAQGPFRRFSDSEIAEFDRFDQPSFDPAASAELIRKRAFLHNLGEFLKAESAVAIVRMSYRDGKLVHGEGYDFTPGRTLALPVMEMAQEDYRRLVRLAATGPAPEISLTINARFDEAHPDTSNIVAEIPGTDPKAGFVMAGAHFDSWIAGDGANDNGAGSVAVIEAARLITRLGIRPKRSIRFVLWSGEEQGLLGSRAYIAQHFVARPVDPALKGYDAYYAWRNAFPLTPKPEYVALKAYFNMDNGSGRFRGIYAEGNVGAAALLGDWLAPFRSMGAGKVVAKKTTGTDHVLMQAVGLPAYQFIQDPLDYGSRVHHSSLDTLDHMRAEDMRQASTVLAGMVWQAATSDKELPRMPLPTAPSPSDPFAVRDPNQ